MMPKDRKGKQNGPKMDPKWFPKSKKIRMKIDTEKGWEKHWKNIGGKKKNIKETRKTKENKKATRPGAQNRYLLKRFQLKIVDFSIPGCSRPGPALKINTLLKDFN